jgi:hypothetical protein
VASSRNSIVGTIHIIRKGLAIYRVQASPFYRVRIWVPGTKKYIVKSTKITSKIQAIDAAEEYYFELKSKQFLDQVPKSKLFETFSDKLIERQKQMAKDGEIHPKQAPNEESIIVGENGLNQFFGKKDVESIRTSDIKAYLDQIRGNRKNKYAPSTLNKKIIVFRKVMKIAYEDGVISSIPELPLLHRSDNPRPFFKFSPLVSDERDEYQMLLEGAKELAAQQVSVRGNLITSELYDFILFMSHSFLRPVESEIFALQHKHIAIASDPKRLILTIANGKTGYRTTNTLEACVSVYERIKQRFPDAKDGDYLFLPKYTVRQTAIKIINRQFNHLLSHLKIKTDPITSQKHTVYSLRHTAICMRLIKSEGKVNIFNLAKTAGTSVDQIERFYAKNLPLSAEMARNLQTFNIDEKTKTE